WVIYPISFLTGLSHLLLHFLVVEREVHAISCLHGFSEPTHTLVGLHDMFSPISLDIGLLRLLGTGGDDLLRTEHLLQAGLRILLGIECAGGAVSLYARLLDLLPDLLALHGVVGTHLTGATDMFAAVGIGVLLGHLVDGSGGGAAQFEPTRAVVLDLNPLPWQNTL